MPAAGVVMIIAVLAIVLALVYYLVSTIVALRQIADGLDEAIAGVGGDRGEERAGQRRGDRHQRAARRRGRPARGPARQEGGPQRRDGPDRERLPRGGRRRTAQLPRERLGGGAPHRRGLHEGHAHARAARPRGADRRRQPGATRCCATSRAAAWPRGCSTRTFARRARRTSRTPRSSAPTPRSNTNSATTSGPLAGGSRFGAPDPRGASCRLRRHSSTSGRPASRARSRRWSGSAPRPGSSPAATACCR